mmetsp:Transcript_52795/g.140131  ORF Transcript_52795/g.140131 Transcript_52795/m.140131 type:complete len:435 (-) Transcript_52795:341-1645(-)
MGLGVRLQAEPGPLLAVRAPGHADEGGAGLEVQLLQEAPQAEYGRLPGVRPLELARHDAVRLVAGRRPAVPRGPAVLRHPGEQLRDASAGVSQVHGLRGPPRGAALEAEAGLEPREADGQRAAVVEQAGLGAAREGPGAEEPVGVALPVLLQLQAPVVQREIHLQRLPAPRPARGQPQVLHAPAGDTQRGPGEVHGARLQGHRAGGRDEVAERHGRQESPLQGLEQRGGRLQLGCQPQVQLPAAVQVQLRAAGALEPCEDVLAPAVRGGDLLHLRHGARSQRLNEGPRREGQVRPHTHRRLGQVVRAQEVILCHGILARPLEGDRVRHLTHRRRQRRHRLCEPRGDHGSDVGPDLMVQDFADPASERQSLVHQVRQTALFIELQPHRVLLAAPDEDPAIVLVELQLPRHGELQCSRERVHVHEAAQKIEPQTNL